MKPIGKKYISAKQGEIFFYALIYLSTLLFTALQESHLFFFLFV